jgi:hypothetical protein
VSDCGSLLGPVKPLRFASSQLDGLRLIGLAIWALKDGTGQNVTFPARQFTANGQRRGFFLLRAITDPAAQDRLREFALQAYRPRSADWGSKDCAARSDGRAPRTWRPAPGEENVRGTAAGHATISRGITESPVRGFLLGKAPRVRAGDACGSRPFTDLIARVGWRCLTSSRRSRTPCGSQYHFTE